MISTLEKLNESFTVYQNPPYDIEKQMSLLWSYRRVIAECLRLEEENIKLRKLNADQTTMMQEWIIKNPTYEAKVTADNWIVENAKCSPLTNSTR